MSQLATAGTPTEGYKVDTELNLVTRNGETIGEIYWGINPDKLTMLYLLDGYAGAFSIQPLDEDLVLDVGDFLDIFHAHMEENNYVPKSIDVLYLSKFNVYTFPGIAALITAGSEELFQLLNHSLPVTCYDSITSDKLRVQIEDNVYEYSANLNSSSICSVVYNSQFPIETGKSIMNLCIYSLPNFGVHNVAIR